MVRSEKKDANPPPKKNRTFRNNTENVAKLDRAFRI